MEVANNEEINEVNPGPLFLTFVSIALAFPYLIGVTNPLVAMTILFMMYRKLQLGFQFGSSHFLLYLIDYDAPLVYAQFGICACRHFFVCLLDLVVNVWYRQRGNLRIRLYSYFCGGLAIILLELSAYIFDQFYKKA